MRIAEDASSKFVVLTSNRSGSVWLMSMLNSVEHVTAQGELFLPRARVLERRWDSDFACPRFIETKPSGPGFFRPFSVFSYLDALYSHPGAVGFKLMYAQLGRYPEILLYFLRHRVRVVHLVRRNHLDVVLSYAVKAKIGRAHLLSGDSPPAQMRVELQADRLVKQMEWLRRKQTWAKWLLRWCRLPHLEVAYEDLRSERERILMILDFLSLERPADGPKSELVKIRTEGHRDVITNYDEVKQVLANSRFAELLD